MLIEPFQKLAKKEASALKAEGARLLDFAVPEAKTRDVQLVPAVSSKSGPAFKA